MVGKKKVWSKVANVLKKSTPILARVLGGPYGAVLGDIIASTLGVEPTEEEVIQALEKDSDAYVKIRQIEADYKTEIARLAFQEEESKIRKETILFQETHETIRKELDNQSAYKSGWRPFYGWSSAVTLSLIKLSIAAAFIFLVFFNPTAGPIILGSMTAMVNALWPIIIAELTVLGVNISKRSQDKQVLMGQQPTSILDLFKRK